MENWLYIYEWSRWVELVRYADLRSSHEIYVRLNGRDSRISYRWVVEECEV